MKCGPDDCPIVAFSDLTPAEQRVERARKARIMSEQGFTETQIAKQFGVSKSTISTDLVNFPETGKLKPAKTASNPKGAGRPKGRPPRRTTADEDKVIASRILDEGKTHEEVQAESGVSNTVVRRAVAKEEGRREAEAIITPEMLSMSAQEKLQAAIKQHQRKLDLMFEARVQEEIGQRLDHLILPVWRKKIAEAKKIYDVRRSITDRKTFNLIIKCLHTDTRQHVDDKTADDAFTRFRALEKYLLNEKDSPTPFTGLPTTAAEWEQRKQEAMVMRRAKRGHANIEKRACA